MRDPKSLTDIMSYSPRGSKCNNGSDKANVKSELNVSGGNTRIGTDFTDGEKLMSKVKEIRVQQFQ